jgi:Bacterial PH domain
MIDVSVQGDRVRFEVEGWDKLWALRSQLEIPLAHIKDVRTDPEAARGWWHGLRMGGTNVPGLLTAGTFYQPGDGWVFFDVHDPERTVVLELEHEHYRRLVIEVADPEAIVKLLRASKTG